MSDETSTPDFDFFSYPGVEPLTPAPCPELVFGLVCPAGVSKDSVCEFLRRELQEYDYDCEAIRISKLIGLIPGYESIETEYSDEAKRINKYMDAGDNIREKCGMGDALAVLAISEIVKLRKEANIDDPNYQNLPSDAPIQMIGRQKKAYILDSLKHPDEIATLRATYGQAFILLSIYSDRDKRVEDLSKKIAFSKRQPAGIDAARSNAEEIVKRDEKEEHKRLGQDVESCFPKADFFLNIDERESHFKAELERLLKVIFNNPYITPTRDEWGMFHAEAASWRSSDLSRQVGASICTLDGDVLALGCNEVPKPLGGLYWEGDENDGRDFQRGSDEGGEHKRLMVAEILKRVQSLDVLNDAAKRKFEELIEKAIRGDSDPFLEGLQALNVIEFGRTVHAEMAALSDAAKRGTPINAGIMYVNTFPCHICARHIIASGIKRVVYIEPYPKSMTKNLFSDSVNIGATTPDNRVLFQPFTGIAPRYYQFAFQVYRKRKMPEGKMVAWSKRDASTKLKRFVTSYIAVEYQIISALLPKIQQAMTEDTTHAQ